MLTVCLITLGDPATLSGGYRYHRRMAELAPRNDAQLRFESLPARLSFAYGPRVLRAAEEADVVLVDADGPPEVVVARVVASLATMWPR